MSELVTKAEAPENYFTELCSKNVTDHVEKKGKFSYLSWPFAIETLGNAHPDAEINVKRFPLAGQPEIKVPYLVTPVGYFVEVEVIINGIRRSQIHPVLNNQNKPIAEPTTFDINTSIQRCLVKAIALHGLGLYIYAGEDLPTSESNQPVEPSPEYLNLIAGLDKFADAGTDSLRDAWEGLSIEQKKLASSEMVRLKRKAAIAQKQATQ